MNDQMESRTVSQFPAAMKHGLITGGLLILFSLLIYALGMMQNKAMGFVSIFLLIGGMFLGAKSFRNQALGGFISYGKAFSMSFLIGLVASVVLMIYTYVFYKFFDPGVIEVIMEQAEEAILERSPDLQDDQLEMALAMTRRMTQPGWLAGMALITNGIASVIIGLILAIFIKREEPFSNQTI